MSYQDVLRINDVDLPSIAENNLGRVFVWHHNCWRWKTTSVSQRMVRFKWFLHHACMQDLPYFKHVTDHQSDLINILTERGKLSLTT